MAKNKSRPGKALVAMVNALIGDAKNAANEYVGKKIWTRKTPGEKRQCGKVTGTLRCQMEGCTGVRLNVLWKDGHRTRPCSKGCGEKPNGDLEIL